MFTASAASATAAAVTLYCVGKRLSHCRHRREKMQVKKEQALIAKALGQDASSITQDHGDSDASSKSSDYERKGVTVRLHSCTID